jgi:hypothetical protein
MSSQRRLDCGRSSVSNRSDAEEDPFESNDDFKTGRDRGKGALDAVGEEAGESDLCPPNEIGLEEVGDSVMGSPGRNTFLELLEGVLSVVRSAEVDGVRERG